MLTSSIATSKISIHGNSFSGIARLHLLKILQRRCEQLGIELRFPYRSFRYRCHCARIAICWSPPTELTAQSESTIRMSLHPTLDVRPNRYIWYGTNKLFHGLTLTFRENDAGVFAAHSYKFNKTTSTFIVECDQETWDAAGFRSHDRRRNARLPRASLCSGSGWSATAFKQLEMDQLPAGEECAVEF